MDDDHWTVCVTGYNRTDFYGPFLSIQEAEEWAAGLEEEFTIRFQDMSEYR